MVHRVAGRTERNLPAPGDGRTDGRTDNVPGQVAKSQTPLGRTDIIPQSAQNIMVIVSSWCCFIIGNKMAPELEYFVLKNELLHFSETAHSCTDLQISHCMSKLQYNYQF